MTRNERNAFDALLQSCRECQQVLSVFPTGTIHAHVANRALAAINGAKEFSYSTLPKDLQMALGATLPEGK